MSVTMARSGGFTTLTLTSDPQSGAFPLYQFLGRMCCSPSRHLRAVMGTSQSVLGALHIMVGLLNIGLGAVLMCNKNLSSWSLYSNAFPHWLGVLFILFGVVCILSERIPSPCLVLLNAILNFLGIGFALAGISLYALNVSEISVWRQCVTYDPDTTPSPAGEEYVERCVKGEDLLLRLLRAFNWTAMALCVLELCLAISSCVLASQSLCYRGNSEDNDNQQQSPDDHGDMEEVIT